MSRILINFNQRQIKHGLYLAANLLRITVHNSISAVADFWTHCFNWFLPFTTIRKQPATNIGCFLQVKKKVPTLPYWKNGSSCCIGRNILNFMKHCEWQTIHLGLLVNSAVFLVRAVNTKCNQAHYVESKVTCWVCMSHLATFAF